MHDVQDNHCLAFQFGVFLGMVAGWGGLGSWGGVL